MMLESVSFRNAGVCGHSVKKNLCYKVNRHRVSSAYFQVDLILPDDACLKFDFISTCLHFLHIDVK